MLGLLRRRWSEIFTADRVYVTDRRTQVWGTRMVFDLEEFQRLRVTMMVPDVCTLHVIMSDAEPDSEMQGTFKPVSDNFKSWEIYIPVPDSLTFTKDDLDTLNYRVGLLTRHVAQASVLYDLFQSTDLMALMFASSGEVLFEDASNKAGLARSFRVLVPSDLPGEIEAVPEPEREGLEHEGERENQTGREDQEGGL